MLILLSAKLKSGRLMVADGRLRVPVGRFRFPAGRFRVPVGSVRQLRQSLNKIKVIKIVLVFAISIFKKVFK